MKTEVGGKEENIIEETGAVESHSAPDTSNIEVKEEEPPREKVKQNYRQWYYRNSYLQIYCLTMLTDRKLSGDPFEANKNAFE